MLNVLYKLLSNWKTINLKIEAGHRIYIKKNLAQRLEAEAKDLGISIDELIIAKLSANSDRAIEDMEVRTIRLESILLELVELMATNNKEMRILP